MQKCVQKEGNSLKKKEKNKRIDKSGRDSRILTSLSVRTILPSFGPRNIAAPLTDDNTDDTRPSRKASGSISRRQTSFGFRSKSNCSTRSLDEERQLTNEAGSFPAIYFHCSRNGPMCDRKMIRTVHNRYQHGVVCGRY